MADAQLDFDEQLALSQAIELIDVVLIRPGGGGATIAEETGTARVMDALGTALDLAWPDHPLPELIEPFLIDARRRVLDRLRSEKGGSAFVAAVDWHGQGRDHVVEHLRADVESIAGALHAWEFIQALDGVAGGEPVRRVAETGVAIKIRASGSFFTGRVPRKQYENQELTAAQFFVPGRWTEIRSAEAVADLIAYSDHVSKQVAHLTSARPFVEERDVHSGDPRWPFALVLRLLREFADGVDPELVPGWLTPWARSVGRDLYPGGDAG